MNLTRRLLLKTASAAAAIVSAPSSLLTSASKAAVASAGTTGGSELFAVISHGKAWGVYNSAHEAYHNASMIRHSAAINTSHVRCTANVANQIKAGNVTSWMEIDGYAVTRDEARSHGMDYLEQAMDRARARTQLFNCHLEDLQQRISRFDEAREDARWMSIEADRLILSEDEKPEGETVLAVSPEAFKAAQDDESVFTGAFGWTMTHEEKAKRLENDGFYKIATDGDSKRIWNVMKLEPKSRFDIPKFIAFEKDTKWIIGAGRTQEDALAMAREFSEMVNAENIEVAPCSKRLGLAVQANGYEVPSFWELDEAIARHEMELTPNHGAKKAGYFLGNKPRDVDFTAGCTGTGSS